MFNDKEKTQNKIETLIGEQCTILGSVKGNGLLKIDGNIEGDIIWDDDLVIGVSSYCKGNISCKNAFVSGKIDGNISCDDTLTIENYGKVIGDITVKNIIINEGGVLQGKCSMKSIILKEEANEELLQ
jgi:cytoskeletal protein CcmA (bactofilin family)